MRNILNAVKDKAAPVYFLYLLLIAYLVFNTGIISDDFDAMARIGGKSALLATGHLYFLHTPLEQVLFYPWYFIFSFSNQVAVNIAKTAYVFMALILIERFFSLYLCRQDACLAAFLFLFFPSHDSTVYSFMSQYLSLSVAFYLFSFYLVQRGRLKGAFTFALAGSFVSYGSFPVAFGLSVLCLLQKKIKNGAVLFIPNIIFSAYYIFIAKILRIGTDKIPNSLNPGALCKGAILQIATFIDTMFGPSMWLKAYYAFRQLGLLSVAIGCVAALALLRSYRKMDIRLDRRLVVSLCAVTAASFAIFALSGMYPQLCFNLGNRTTIFGSLLLAYLTVCLPASRMAKISLFAAFFFVILGISDHWKVWNLRQGQVIHNIQTNLLLRAHAAEEVIYVTGNQYSHYGNIGHVEFLSEEWVTGPLFRLLLGNPAWALPLNKRFVYSDGYLLDRKYLQRRKVGSGIAVYDSERNLFLRVPAADINRYLASLPNDYRHWLQLCGNKFINGLVLWLAPRLEYAI